MQKENGLKNAIKCISETLFLSKRDVMLIAKHDKRRVFNLLILSKTLRASCLFFNEQQLHRPLIDEFSLFDLLRQQNLDIERVVFFVSRLNLTAKSDALTDPFGSEK